MSIKLDQHRTDPNYNVTSRHRITEIKLSTTHEINKMLQAMLSQNIINDLESF